MDIQQIAKMFNLNGDTVSRVVQAWTTAQQMGAGVHSKQDALKLLTEKGIDAKQLETVNKYLYHPMAGVVAQMAGVNLEKVRNDFKNLTSAPTTTVRPASDSLAKYKQGLKQL